MIDWQVVIAVLALLASGLAAVYSRRSVGEARKANDIGRLNALLALRSHYLELMQHQEKLAQLLNGSSEGLKAAHSAYADLDSKLGEVNREIEKQHAAVIR